MILHPNEENSQDGNDKSAVTGQKKEKGKCRAYFARFDTLVIKPLLIYKYDKDLHKKKQEFIELFMRDGERIQEAFVRD
jgi:hypothetical protein